MTVTVRLRIRNTRKQVRPRGAAKFLYRCGAFLALSAVLGLSCLTGSAALAAAQDERRVALLLTVADAITPATMDYVQRGIGQAEDRGAELLILALDTPGGLVTSTRELIKSILAARVPVVTYVSPSGSRAASAGTYILLASHVAAMAPATHLGSATPVQLGGLPGMPSDDPAAKRSKSEGPDSDDEGSQAPGKAAGDGKSAMERKVMEDAVSYIRELAQRHNRNADWAERAVREAANLGASEALAQNVIDVVAKDTDDLLVRLDGMTVNLARGDTTLNTGELAVVRFDPDWRTRLLSVITDPNIAYFLLLLGFYGIVFELANPGSLVPGVIGATCLLLALFAFQILSVNYAGLALILLGLMFIVAEAFLPSFGILGVGGVVAFVAGSVILMDAGNQAVSLPVIGGVGAVAAGFLLWAVTRLVSLRRKTPVYGVEHLGEEVVVAMERFEAHAGRYQGHVRMNGERWRAVSDEPIDDGDTVQVVSADGLTLQVKASEQH